MKINNKKVKLITVKLCSPLLINWFTEKHGFGQIYIEQNKKGEISIDSEYMGKEFVGEVLEMIIQEILEEGKLKC